MFEEATLRGGPRNGRIVRVGKGAQYLTFIALRGRGRDMHRMTYRRIWTKKGPQSSFAYMVEKRS